MSHEALGFPARGLSQRRRVGGGGGGTAQMGSVNKTIAARPHTPAAVADLCSVCPSTGRNSVQIRPRGGESKVYSGTRYMAQIKAREGAGVGPRPPFSKLPVSRKKKVAWQNSADPPGQLPNCSSASMDHSFSTWLLSAPQPGSGLPLL